MVPRPWMCLLSAACVTCLWLPERVSAAPDVTRPHVRTVDRQLSQAIRNGLSQSATFRALVDRLDGLPGLVFVVSSPCGARQWDLPACLEHRVRTVGGLRWLRINIHANESGARLLALIAHELQHAVEVLSEDDVTSQRDVEALLARIGDTPRSGIFETEAARRMEVIVLREAREHERREGPTTRGN